jgi:16S rRNA processing protein RimM
MQSKTEWATIGKIVALFGLRGELKVVPLSDIPDRFTQLAVIYLSPDYACYAIEGVRPYKGEMVLLKLGGIDDAHAAEVLRNRDLCIPFEELAQLPPDSYYQHDILGLHVHTLEDREIGTIVDIMTTGSNDVYVVKEREGRQFLIPAVKAIVRQVDLQRRRMYIDPIKGLLDEEEALVDNRGEQIKEEAE